MTSAFRALNGGYFLIVFSVIGISFLLPTNISSSFWKFQVLAMVMYVVMGWMGYRASLYGKWALMPQINMGSGAMLVFGLVILWTCRKYLFCAIQPAAIKDLEADERRELRISSFLFLLGSLSLTLILTLQFKVSLFFTLLYLVLVLMTTVVSVRMVAEGGIIGLHSGLTAIDLWTRILGATKAWSSSLLFAPLIVFNTVFLGTLKGFIAPSMANALKVREQIRIRRLAFHGAIATGILVSTLVSIITLIILCYDVGANSLNKAMHEAKVTAPGIGRMIENPPESNAVDSQWIVAGALLMAGLIYTRRSVFWMPHPIGLVALMNPMMMNFWGSIFIGWVFKSLVSKYGDEQQYLRIRCFFIGLVVGHLFACLLGLDQLEWLRPNGI
jgi:hypothetical protein